MMGRGQGVNTGDIGNNQGQGIVDVSKGRNEMKVNKKSWHYRLLHQTMEGCPEFEYNNLCSYFWALVFTLVVKLPIAGCFILLDQSDLGTGVPRNLSLR